MYTGSIPVLASIKSCIVGSRLACFPRQALHVPLCRVPFSSQCLLQEVLPYQLEKNGLAAEPIRQEGRSVEVKYTIMSPEEAVQVLVEKGKIHAPISGRIAEEQDAGYRQSRFGSQ